MSHQEWSFYMKEASKKTVRQGKFLITLPQKGFDSLFQNMSSS